MNDLVVVHVLDKVEDFENHVPGLFFRISFASSILPPNRTTLLRTMFHDHNQSLVVLVHIKNLQQTGEERFSQTAEKKRDTHSFLIFGIRTSTMAG